MEATPADPMARRMAGFKDFYQFASTTRVIAGRSLASTGFELQRRAPARVLVTDAGVSETGLVERVEEGLVDGGLEVAGVFRDVPRTRRRPWWTAVRRRHARPGRTRSSPWAGDR